MSSKLNVWGVVRDHIGTLRNFDTGRYSPGDILLFIVIPAIFAAGLTWLRIKITEQIANGLITALSVFAGLLFNLLLLIYDIVQKDQGAADNAKLQRLFLKEIYANISFCILISITSIILLSVFAFGITVNALAFALCFVIYFFLAVFVFTLLMVLKRVHVLLSKEFANKV